MLIKKLGMNAIKERAFFSVRMPHVMYLYVQIGYRKLPSAFGYTAKNGKNGIFQSYTIEHTK